MNELDNEKIFEKLDTIETKVDEVLLWKAGHSEAHKLIVRDLTDVRTTLYSNPGLVSKVANLWSCKSDITKWREFWLWILRYLIVVGAVAVITWLFLLYKGH